MRCKIEMCPYRAVTKVKSIGPTNWTVGESTTPKECRGFPMNPIETTHLCYFHTKKGTLIGEGNERFCGKQSNPTLITNSGETRVLGADWR